MGTILAQRRKNEGLILHQIGATPCKADNNLTELHLFNEKSFVLSSDTLKKVGEELPSDQFYRIHRSHCVNRDYIKSINRNTGLAVEMRNGVKLEIAKDKKEDFYRWLGI